MSTFRLSRHLFFCVCLGFAVTFHIFRAPVFLSQVQTGSLMCGATATRPVPTMDSCGR